MLFQRKAKKTSAEDSCLVHEYELLKRQDREIWVEELGKLFTETQYFIYCPKCRTSKVVSPLEWELIQGEQECDRRFMEKHNILYLEKGSE